MNQSYTTTNSEVTMERETDVDNSAVSKADWFISILISAIPFVGLVMLFVWAFGGDFQESKVNWAKAMLIYWLILIIAFILFLMFFDGVQWMRDMGL